MKGGNDKQLTVLNVAYPFSPVGSDAVGGAEQILSLIDCALDKEGHTSLVAACEGSKVAGRLFPVPLLECEAFDEPERRWYSARMQAAIDRALLLHRVDFIHMHGLDFYKYDLPSGIPVLVTLHLPIAWYGIDRLKRLQERVELCCVSESQARSCRSQLGDLPVVENGVEMPAWTPYQPKDNFVLVMGRICPEKNVHAALEAGSLANTPVCIGGRVFPYRTHQEYFDRKVAPLLQSTSHRFLGALSVTQRHQLLGRAKCLLHPTLAPETSSLVAMEALAQGTPVIAFRSGALPEIVEHGVTGFVVDNVQQMAEALHHVHEIWPRACRDAAERRFSSERMIGKYLHLYRALACESELDRAYA